ncbi:hypothetical protein EDEG_03377 [Edhazardia aedis USNM 41457]|uniref:Uncharacterized protein n=1 Tax=Edhazardia aedis (strain USNM 41457) TaxID=1003232 RepID=J9D2Z0_EDHAE|nr:hypothetical protein EDEG_03377 [Edhazardia aedis USNM 41457]|eukprot:EJW02181.1 hypothetical protein EDEG_03377 [Edhazardia aedis USNM 41457]
MIQPLMNFEDEVFSKFPEIKEARLCANQQNYNLASELYSDFLNKLSEKGFKQDDPLMCYIYIEYASALIESAALFFVEELEMLANCKSTSASRKAEKEDDLEIAWNILEIAKLVFLELDDKENLLRIYFLLGEIQVLNNQFDDAIAEYNNCYEILIATSKSPTNKMSECLWKIATCYEFMKNYEEACKCLNKIIALYEKSKEELGDKADQLIQEIKEKLEDFDHLAEIKKHKSQDKTPIKPMIDDNVVIDINKFKKKKN